jgi:hypothetical protein
MIGELGMRMKMKVKKMRKKNAPVPHAFTEEAQGPPEEEN